MGVEPIDSRSSIQPLNESSLDMNTSYARILHLIEGSPKVVHFGCGEGYLARFLTQRGCTVFGVEIDPDAAGLAREFCADVLIADLDHASPLKLFPTERFDVALFAGVLEQLRKPQRLLAETPRILRSGGYVIASIRNAAHGAIRLAMLKADFNDRDVGALRHNNLRFFNRKSLEELFQETGFIVEEMARTAAPVFDAGNTSVPALDRSQFSDSIVTEIEQDSESRTLEFIVKALPASSSAAQKIESKRTAEALAQRVAELEEQLASASAKIDANVDAPTREHLDEVQRQLHLALLGPDGVEALRAQVQQKSDELTAMREQMTALAAREESTARREAKLAKENLEAAESASILRQAIVNHDATIAALRAELDVSAATIRNVSAELTNATEREKQLSQDNSAAQRALSKFQLEVAARDSSILELQREVASARREIAAERKQLLELQQRWSSQESRLAEASTTIREQTVAIEALETELEAAQEDTSRVMAQLRNVETLYRSVEVLRKGLADEVQAIADESRALKEQRTATLRDLETTGAELLEHKRLLGVALKELHDLQATVTELSARCERDEFYLAEMRKSKFWRLRNGWFSVKRAFGIPTDIP